MTTELTFEAIVLAKYTPIGFNFMILTIYE